MYEGICFSFKHIEKLSSIYFLINFSRYRIYLPFYPENSVEKNPITSQISNLRTKVGSPSQLMNRIAESARTRTRSTGKRQQHNDSLATLQEVIQL